MSLSAELKDFSSSFRSTTDMWTRYSREKDMAAYRKQKLADNTPGAGFGGEPPSGSGGASSGASGGVKLSPDEQKATARKIYSSLLDKGYNTNAAAGITGNLWHESGGFGGGSGDSGSAHGIAQWRGDRWTKMQEYAKSKGKDPNDLNTQVDYLDQELRTDYKSAYNLLQHASDVKTATGIFADQFEKPAGSGKGNYGGISGMSNRLNFASQVANFGGGAIGTRPVSPTARIKALSTGPQASLGAAPPQVATAASYMGAPAPETQLGQDTVASADDEDQNQFASADQQQDDDQDVQGAASGGLIKGYATGGAVEEPDFTGVDKGINTNFNPTFRKSLLNLQQRATAAGIKTKLISGVRTLDDQKELYANFLAGQAGKPLPFPKRGAVKVAAKPGTSPHEAGAAADLVAANPKDQAKVDALAKEDKNLGLVAGDPGHYQLNSGGKGGAPDTAVASGGKPAPPVAPEEQPDDPAFAETDDGAASQSEERSSNAQGLADATERGRANQAYMASEAQYGHQRLLQEGATNQAALDQESAARSTPPPPAQTAQPQEAEGAARGGLIRGYAPGGVVDATGYIAPDTANLSSSTQALLPAVAAASQATPQAAVPTTTAAAPAAAPAATAAPAAADPNAGLEAKGSQARAMQDAGYGDWGVLDPSMKQSSIPHATTSDGMPYGQTSLGRGVTGTSWQGPGGGVTPQPAAPAAPATPPPVTGTDRGSVWDPATQTNGKPA